MIYCKMITPGVAYLFWPAQASLNEKKLSQALNKKKYSLYICRLYIQYIHYIIYCYMYNKTYIHFYIYLLNHYKSRTKNKTSRTFDLVFVKARHQCLVQWKRAQFSRCSSETFDLILYFLCFILYVHTTKNNYMNRT